MRKYKWYWTSKQRRGYDCGITCVLNILHYYGKTVKRADLRAFLKDNKIKKEGASMYDLIKELEVHGVAAQGVRCDRHNLMQDDLCPAILVVETLPGNSHYIIAYEVASGIVTIADPSILTARISHLSISQFNKRYKWDGLAILIDMSKANIIS